MNFKTSIAISFGLVLTSSAFFNDISAAQAQSKKPGKPILPCKKVNCANPSPNGTFGDGNVPPLIKEIIAKGNDFLRNKQYYLAQEQFSQALEQAKLIGNPEGEAIAHTRLGEIFTTTGKFKEASGHLTTAKNIYETLQNKQGINSVNRQLGVIRIQQRQLQQINPSRFKTHQR